LSPNSDAEADTKAIVRAVLAQLIKEGRKPATEGIRVTVSARQDGFKGETGTPMSTYFGDSFYRYIKDRIEWDIYRAR
jgi:hypothetical protein